MCGICGISNTDLGPIDIEELMSMNNTIQHRGPDDDGYYQQPGIGLAVRRLRIIDVAGGDQPIANEDETIWIVYNGECFNYPELTELLEKKGHRFRTKSDTECIVHLYEEYGVDCVNYLRGQFAFALWDQIEKRLFIARDRLGQKPIYYTVHNGKLLFGSEISCILAELPERPALDLQSIDHYLSLQYIPEPLTPYKNIFKLPAAHRLVWQKGALNVERYWELEYGPKHKKPEEELISELRHLVKQSVEMRMISEVPLGVHLSGGLDSSIVVSQMAEYSHHPVKTFSVGFKEDQFSEVSFARQVANRFATEHYEFTLTFGDVPSTVDKMLSNFGEPFADPSALPLYHLSKLTREYVTVALNGDGGDEAFAGYQRYWLDPWANRYLKIPKFVTAGMYKLFVPKLRDIDDKPVGSSLINGLKRMNQVGNIDQRASILRWGSYFSGQIKSELWKPEYASTLDLDKSEKLLIEKFQNTSSDSYLDKTLYSDNSMYLPGDLLVKADRMTMANSLEGRSPFLDHELAGWAARLPEKYKIRGFNGKYLLRKAFAKELPKTITNRKKQGFGIPVGSWFRKPLLGWAQDTLLSSDSLLQDWFKPKVMERLISEHVSGRTDHGKRLWGLVILGQWLKQI